MNLSLSCMHQSILFFERFILFLEIFRRWPVRTLYVRESDSIEEVDVFR